MHRRQQGFTLIEAIVSLVLIASSGMALFSWINSNIMTLNRVRESNAQNAATANALDYIDNINPMATPEGVVNLDAYRLIWKAEATTESYDNANYPFGIGLYQVALYKTKVSVLRPDGQQWFAFTVQQTGYRRVRDIVLPF
jgi:general secretion pathway protein I